MGTDEEIDSLGCVDCNMATHAEVCRPSPAGRFGRGTEVGDATMIYSVKVLLLRPAQAEPEFSIGIDARLRLASKVRLWCVYGTLG